MDKLPVKVKIKSFSPINYGINLIKEGKLIPNKGGGVKGKGNKSKLKGQRLRIKIKKEDLR